MDDFMFRHEADDLRNEGFNIHAADVTREQLDEIRGSYYRLKHNGNVMWWVAVVVANLLPLFILKAQFPHEFFASNGTVWSYIGMVYMFVSGWAIYALIKRGLHSTVQDMIDVARIGNDGKKKGGTK